MNYRNFATMKDKNLCQATHCPNSYTKTVTGWRDRHGGYGWTLRLCDVHAEDWEKYLTTEVIGGSVNITPRREDT